MFTVSNQNNVHSILNNWCICINISCGYHYYHHHYIIIIIVTISIIIVTVSSIVNDIIDIRIIIIAVTLSYMQSAGGALAGYYM